MSKNQMFDYVYDYESGDILFVKKFSTINNKPEVSILLASSYYKNWKRLRPYETGIKHEIDDSYEFLFAYDGSKKFLYMIKKSLKAEIHALREDSDFATFLMQTPTELDLKISEHNSWQFLLSPSHIHADIIGIKKNNTRSKKTEIFYVIAPDYDVPNAPIVTGFPELYENWQFVPSKNPKRAYKNFIAMKLNGSNSTECHICFEREDYDVVEGYPTVLPKTNVDDTKFLIWEYDKEKKCLFIIGCTIDPHLLAREPHESHLSMLFPQPAKFRYFFKLKVDVRDYSGRVWFRQ